MGFLSSIFGPKPYPSANRREVSDLIDALVKIGKTEDYLSEHPGGLFNGQSRNIEAIRIGRRLDEVGGLPLLQYAYNQVRKKAGKQLAGHLEYAWDDLGSWVH